MFFFFFNNDEDRKTSVNGRSKDSHNVPSEQINTELSLEVAMDQVLKAKEQEAALAHFLGEDKCSVQNICGRKVFVYENDGKEFILLHKAITYLGNPHPIFKKRIQLPTWMQEFCENVKAQGLDYDVRLIGVYHYMNGVVFADFDKEPYLKRKMHNSSAHIYINDIFQAYKQGVFHKIDQFGNHIHAIHSNKFKDYLMGKTESKNQLFELFEKFNCGYTFGEWLYALDAIKEMHGNQWMHWQQAEWAGWFLEYRFNKFTIDNNTTHLMRYVGTENKAKKEGTFDFDIFFPKDNFYGDLKASDIEHRDAPGNDQGAFVECINMHDRFWYVIYEHETKKDIDCGSVATIARNQFIRSVKPDYEKDDMSYHERMKNSVRFVKMSILELNRINFRSVLSDFNQGKQPDGKARAKKFIIKKKDMDQYVVYRYNYEQA